MKIMTFLKRISAVCPLIISYEKIKDRQLANENNEENGGGANILLFLFLNHHHRDIEWLREDHSFNRQLVFLFFMSRSAVEIPSSFQNIISIITA